MRLQINYITICSTIQNTHSKLLFHYCHKLGQVPMRFLEARYLAFSLDQIPQDLNRPDTKRSHQTFSDCCRRQLPSSNQQCHISEPSLGTPSSNQQCHISEPSLGTPSSNQQCHISEPSLGTPSLAGQCQPTVMYQCHRVMN